jgi:peptidoglycan/LPS O-acetylase OafA/YrhL
MRVWLMVQLSSKMAQQNYRGVGFDWIRITAALVVVLHHSSSYITPDIRNDVLYSYSRGVVSFGSLAVDIFFATSGFLVALSLMRTGDVIAFSINRFLRIMPALFATVMASMFLLGPLATNLTIADYFRDLETYTYLKNLTFRMTPPLPGTGFINNSLWTIYFEVLSYIALLALFVLRILSSRRKSFLLFTVVYIASACFWFNGDVKGLVPDRLVTFLCLFVYFFAGVMMFLNAQYIPYDGRFALAAIALLGLTLPMGLGVFALPICVPYLIVYFGFSGMMGRKPLTHDFSYGMYLNHCLILFALERFYPPPGNFFLAAFVALSGTAPIAYLSWRFIEAPALHLKASATKTAKRLLNPLLTAVGANS